MKHCHVHIPYSVSPEILSRIDEISTNKITTDADWQWSFRLIDYLEEIDDGLDDWKFSTIIRDPIQRMCQIYQNWVRSHEDISWHAFMDDPGNQRNCYRAFDYYVGEYDDLNVAIIAIEETEKIEKLLDGNLTSKTLVQVKMDTSGVPAWACHMVCQFNPYEARYYGYDSRPPSCKDAENKTIVIVGSNECLLKSSMGQVIDENDIVARINNAPMQGYEQHVGGKTDVVMLNATLTGGTNLSIPPSAIADIHIKNGVELWHVPVFSIRGCFKDKNGYLPILETGALYEQITSKLGRPPSTGLIAVMAAIVQGFKKITIAGFGDLGNENTYSHYYGGDVYTHCHNFLGENEVLRQWIEMGIIHSLD